MSTANVPFETTLLVRDTCLCLHVQRAARALSRRFDEALRPLDLTNGQFSVLMSLNRPKPPGMGEVAALLDREVLDANELRMIIEGKQLPARVVHCLHNTGDSMMRVVAVFRPAGSPAAAYYADGTPAYPGAPSPST